MVSVIREKDFERTMRTVVEPFLSAHGRARYIWRERGRRIYVAVYEPDEAPRGIILVSHGFTESAEKYKELLYYFVQMGYQAVMPEHCGHGRSYRMTEDPSLVHVDSWERYVEDLLYVARLASGAKPDLPVCLYGHSMGGGIAAAAAAKEPDLFAKVILSSPMIRPSTGDVPWRTAQHIAEHFCRVHKPMRYVIGQRSYEENERFEDSSSTSRPRFEYYQRKRAKDQRFQQSAASYGWLREAGKLNRYLMQKGWKKIESPVLLFQAERETLVSKREQERFIRKLYRRGMADAVLVRVPGTKHEIFNSRGRVLELYWKKVSDFFEEA